METKKRKRTGLNVGTSLILVTFVLLCLVAFAALSFTTANSDYELSKQTADKTTAYYEAVNIAEEQLADIDRALTDLATHTSDDDAYKEAVIKQYTDSSYSFEDMDGILKLSFTVPINTNMSLDVELCLNDYSKATAGSTYLIIRYQTITTADVNTQTIEGDGGLIL